MVLSNCHQEMINWIWSKNSKCSCCGLCHASFRLLAVPCHSFMCTLVKIITIAFVSCSSCWWRWIYCPQKWGGELQDKWEYLEKFPQNSSRPGIVSKNFSTKSVKIKIFHTKAKFVKIYQFKT